VGIQRLHLLPCGKLHSDLGFLERGKRSPDRITIPVPCYLIEHDKGLVLVDTGMNPEVITNAQGYWGRPVEKELFVPIYQENETPMSKIKALGYELEDIKFVINTHLHNDHSGCNHFFKNAVFTIHQREYDWALQENPPPGYILQDYNSLNNVKLIDQETDFFNDGTIRIIETPGHSPGHCSLIVDLPKTGKIMLLGDAVYTRAQLEESRPSANVFDKELAILSIEKIKQISQEEKTNIFIGHDQRAWNSLNSFWLD
jgi:N-acyl homoserine lactone hydrolase